MVAALLPLFCLTNQTKSNHSQDLLSHFQASMQAVQRRRRNLYSLANSELKHASKSFAFKAARASCQRLRGQCLKRQASEGSEMCSFGLSMNQSHQTKAQVAQQASTAKTAVGMEHKLLLRTSSTEKTRKPTKTKAMQKCKGTRHISTQSHTDTSLSR